MVNSQQVLHGDLFSHRPNGLLVIVFRPLYNYRGVFDLKTE